MQEFKLASPSISMNNLFLCAQADRIFILKSIGVHTSVNWHDLRGAGCSRRYCSTMSSENHSRRSAVHTMTSGPVLQEAQRVVNRTPEGVGNNDDSGRSSVTKPTSNLRGLSIDMTLVFSDESSDIQSEQPYDERFSPLSEDSTTQPQIRPRPPMSAKNSDVGNQPPVVSTQQSQQPSEATEVFRPSATDMSSRRAKILAKVSSRITRIRQDKKLNDRFTVPKMDDILPQPLPELQDLCIEEEIRRRLEDQQLRETTNNTNESEAGDSDDSTMNERSGPAGDFPPTESH